jgi:hypothetical protein
VRIVDRHQDARQKRSVSSNPLLNAAFAGSSRACPDYSCPRLDPRMGHEFELLVSMRHGICVPKLAYGQSDPGRSLSRAQPRYQKEA